MQITAVVLAAPNASKYGVAVDNNGALLTISGAVGDVVTVILASPNGSLFLLGVDNNGALTTQTSTGESAEVVLTAPNGARFLVGVDNNGALVTSPWSYDIEVEFVTGSFTNVSAESLGFTITRERGEAGIGIAAGRTMIVADNFDGRWSPDNASSPYAPNIKPNRRLRIRAAWQGSTYALFTGFLDSVKVEPALERRRATIKATDRIKRLGKIVITLGSVFTDINVGSVWTHVLSGAGIATDQRSIDRLFDVLPFAWYAREKPANDAIRDLLDHGRSYAYLAGNDVLHVKDRYWPGRQTVIASLVNDFLALGYTMTDERIINRAVVRSKPRKRRPLGTASLAWIKDPIFIPASSGIGFELSYRDEENAEDDVPSIDMIAPVNGTDYLTNTSSVSVGSGSGTDKTALASAQVTFRATSAVCSLYNGSDLGVYLTRFVLRGTPVQKQPELIAPTDDASSQNVYGKREFTLVNDFIGTQAHATDYSTFLVQEGKEPRGDLTVTLKNQFPGILAREIGDVLHVVESNAAVGSRWVITGIAHTVRTERDIEHETEYDLEFFRDPEWLILDDDPKGKLDQRRVAF